MAPLDGVGNFRVRAGLVGLDGTFEQLRIMHIHTDILYWLRAVTQFLPQFGNLVLLLDDGIVEQLHLLPQYLILQLDVVQTFSQFPQFPKALGVHFRPLDAGRSCSLLELGLLLRVDLFDELHLLVAGGLFEFLLQKLLLPAEVFLLQLTVLVLPLLHLLPQGPHFLLVAAIGPLEVGDFLAAAGELLQVPQDNFLVLLVPVVVGGIFGLLLLGWGYSGQSEISLDVLEVALDEVGLLFDFGEQMIVGIGVLNLRELLRLPGLRGRLGLDPASVGQPKFGLAGGEQFLKLSA